MRKNIFLWALILALQSATSAVYCNSPVEETKSIGVQAGDTLAINSDFGRIRIRPSDATSVDLTMHKVLPAPSSSIEVVARKSGAIVFVYTFFSGDAGEAVNFEIRAPSYLNVMIWGANPEIDVAGMRGAVRVQVITGRITAEDVTSATSLISDRGDIIYRANAQPRGDLRLESSSGNVYCELSDMLNLRGWIHAGGSISWQGEPPVQAGSFEKQLGTLGPLLYAASLNGNVEVRLKQGRSTPAQTSQAVYPRDPAPIVTAAPSGNPTPEPARQPRSAEPSVDHVGHEPPTAASQPVALPDGGYAVKVNVDSVFLNVSVRERGTNRAIPGLGKQDFRIYEDGVEQQVQQLAPTEAPFNLLLLLDVSGSTSSYLHLMKEAAIDFTRQINSNDRIAIATFNSSVQLVENFTSDRAAAERAIQRIRSGGGTAFYDALASCIDSYMRGLEGRSAIVVFTDGVDNQLDRMSGGAGSRTTFDELYRRVQEADTIIYTIFLDTEGQTPTMTRNPGIIWPRPRSGGGFPFPLPIPIPMPAPVPRQPRGNERAIYDEARQQLLDIAEQTGGRMYSPHRIEELSGAYSQIADDLRIQYQLGYNSTNRTHDGRWRQIRVEVTSHPGAVVRTRKGYYARKNA